MLRLMVLFILPKSDFLRCCLSNFLVRRPYYVLRVKNGASYLKYMSRRVGVTVRLSNKLNLTNLKGLYDLDKYVGKKYPPGLKIGKVEATMYYLNGLERIISRSLMK